MLLPGGVDSVKGLVAAVQEKADAVPVTQIQYYADDIGCQADSM